jgi:hypothetical protein
MKKLLFLLGFIFFFFNAEAQELAYAETNTDLPAMTNIKFTVSSIYRDSLFWFMDVDIRPIEGSWKTSATVHTKSKTKPSYVRKGAKGTGTLEVKGRKYGFLGIEAIGIQKFRRPKSFYVEFDGVVPRI